MLMEIRRAVEHKSADFGDDSKEQPELEIDLENEPELET
jgi:hypothetical protein